MQGLLASFVEVVTQSCTRKNLKNVRGNAIIKPWQPIDLQTKESDLVWAFVYCKYKVGFKNEFWLLESMRLAKPLSLLRVFTVQIISD